MEKRYPKRKSAEEENLDKIYSIRSTLFSIKTENEYVNVILNSFIPELIVATINEDFLFIDEVVKKIQGEVELYSQKLMMEDIPNE